MLGRSREARPAHLGLESGGELTGGRGSTLGRSFGRRFHGDRWRRGRFRPASGWNRSGKRRRRRGMGLGRPSREGSEGVRPGMGGVVEGRRARRRGVRASERGAVDNLITKASWRFGRLQKRVSQRISRPMNSAWLVLMIMLSSQLILIKVISAWGVTILPP